MSDTYDFLEHYWPAAAELPLARILEHREAIATLVNTVAPDVDTSPNSPYGDLFITPAAAGQAAREIAVNRLLSDLNPANAEAGEVHNCLFVERFFGNFGIHDQDHALASGLMRLRFTSAERRTLDRSTTFRLANSDFKPYLPQAGPAVLLAPGEEPLPGDANVLRYSMFDDDSWVVDILVSGQAGAVVSEGSSAAVDRQVPGLSGFAALADFDTGVRPERIQELARRIRTNFHPRTPVTRGGAENMVTQMFPSITLTGCTVSGDFEMRRDAANPAGVASGKVDLMVRSRDLAEDTVLVRLLRVPGEDGYRLRGWLNLPETPVLVLSVGNGTAVFAHDLYSVSSDPLKPGLSAAYGTAERLFLDMELPMDGGLPLIPWVEENGETVSYAEVTYLFDPALAAVGRYAAADECRAPGIDLYVRWFVPILVSDLVCSYNRKAGVAVNLAQARTEILSGYNGHTLASPAGPHTVNDSMLYAGAHSVQEIGVTAAVRMSVAAYVWLGEGVADPENDWATFAAGCESVPEVSVVSAYGQPVVPDNSSPVFYCAAGARNLTWLLPSQALRFVELRTV